MGKDEMESEGKGKMLVMAALLLTVGMLGSAYMLSMVDYSPKVNISNGPSNPNVYVSSTPPDHAIAVSATASKKVSPDLLNIQIRVQTQSDNAKTAQNDNAAVVADLMTKLKAQGLKDEEIQTVSYSVDPVYESSYICNQAGTGCHYDSKLTGYRATHSLNVKISDL